MNVAIASPGPLSTTVAVSLAALVGAGPAAAARDQIAPRITDVAVRNGGKPYAGDRPLLTTISPNGDELRDRAAISFRLSERARVRLTISRTTTEPISVYTRTGVFGRGRHTLFWSPAKVNPRTYVVGIEAIDGAGNRRVYGATNARTARSQRTAVIRVLGVDAGFGNASYRPGATASLRVETDAPSFTLQLFRAGPEGIPTYADNVMHGVPVTTPVEHRLRRRNRSARVRVDVPALASGLYFARLATRDGRVGYAPLIVRPPLIGGHRAAIVLPTYTWQSYNFRDADGDGYGDTWYAGAPGASVRLGRPYLRRGVPPHYRKYELGFLRWLAETGKQVDVLADVDLERTHGGAALAVAYDLVVFPGHTEYVTERMYEVVKAYRDYGGNLMFLASNNFFYKVARRGPVLKRLRKWRQLGRPEAALIGVQYRANDDGRTQRPFVVRDTASAPWFWRGTGLAPGSLIGQEWGGFGIEIDMLARSSPPGTIVLAEIPDIYGPGFTAQMTYYEMVGAKVFAAGAMNVGGRALFWPLRQIFENLWARLSRP